MKSSTTIYVNPVPKVSAQGRDKQTFTIIDPVTGELRVTKSMNKTREFGVGVRYMFQYDYNRGRLVTGLDEFVPNPYYKMEVHDVVDKLGLSTEWRTYLEKIVNQQDIKKQTVMEINFNLSPDYLTPEFSTGSLFNNYRAKENGKEPNFLEKFEIILYDNPNRFSDDTLRGALAIQLINNHNKIAKNKNEINSARHEFYISEENEAQVEKARKQEVINDAIYQLVKLQKEGGDFRNYQVGVLLQSSGKSLIEGSATTERVKNTLNDFINVPDKHQMSNIEQFSKIIKMLESKEGRERFAIMYLVQQAVNTNVIGIKDGYYIWYSKSGTPNVYKHSDYNKLVSLLITEFKTSSDKTVTNWYNDLYQEVLEKGIRFE